MTRSAQMVAEIGTAVCLRYCDELVLRIPWQGGDARLGLLPLGPQIDQGVVRGRQQVQGLGSSDVTWNKKWKQ
jgi:hypothetical protein